MTPTEQLPWPAAYERQQARIAELEAQNIDLQQKLTNLQVSWLEKVFNIDDLKTARAEEIRLTREIKRLEADLQINAAMLARQCDLAREAEIKQAQAEAETERLRSALLAMKRWYVTDRRRAYSHYGRISAKRFHLLMSVDELYQQARRALRGQGER